MASAGAVFYTYLGYPVVLFMLSRVTLWRRRPPGRMKLPRVTVLVAAYNEEAVISEKITNTLSLDYPRELLDVVVASDGSTDATNRIVREVSRVNPRVRLLELPRRGKSGAINSAMKTIREGVVVLTDANTMLKPRSLKKLVRHFASPEVGCVSGRLAYTNPGSVVSGAGEGLYWRYETLLKKMESRLGWVAGANGAIYAVRRELFTELEPDTINDDFVISMRVVEKGKRCVYEPRAVGTESVAPDVRSEFRRHVRDGAGHYIALRRLWRLLNPLLGARAWVYWSHRVLRWAAPFLLLAMVPLNAALSGEAVYRGILIGQGAFYTAAALGLVFSRFGRVPFFVYVPFYFCNLHLALLLGFVRAVSSSQKPAWEPEREGKAA